MERRELEELITKYQFLVYGLAKKIKTNYICWDDLIQSGNLGLIMAINKHYNKEEGHFINIASKLILGEMMKEIKMMNSYYISKSFLKIIKIVKENKNLSLEEISTKFNLTKDIIIEALNYLEQRKETDVEIKDEYYNYLNGLEEEERNILIDRFYLNKSRTDLCKKYNLSPYKLKIKLNKILLHLKNAL